MTPTPPPPTRSSTPPPEPEPRRRRLLRAARNVLATALIALLVASTGPTLVGRAKAALGLTPLAAPSGYVPYIHRQDGTAADPVNLIFLNGTVEEARAALVDVLAWPETSGGAMFFGRDGEVRATGLELEVALGGGVRMHLRVESGPAGEVSPYLLAAVHRDEVTTCGHVGRGFDVAREIVARAFRDRGYRVQDIEAGNTEPGQHCDGSRTAGDGTIVLVDLSR